MGAVNSEESLFQPEIAIPAGSPKPPRLHWPRIVAAVLCVLYLVALVGLIIYIRTRGDRTTTGTLLLFGPRWPFALPLVLLIPLTAWLDRLLLILSVGSAAVALFGLLGFSVGWRRLLPASPAVGPVIRVLSYNAHFNPLGSSSFVAYIQNAHPDVIALEEWDNSHLHTIFTDSGWHFLRIGENALVSRFPIEPASIHRSEGFFNCTLSLPSGPTDVVVLHFRSPHVALRNTVEEFPSPSSEIINNIAWRTDQSAAVHRLMQRESHPLLLIGDFNLVPDSVIFRQNFSDFSDAFDAAGFGLGYSYMSRWTGVRIDHVLTNSSFRCESCFVGPFLGSPHRPLVADLIPIRG